MFTIKRLSQCNLEDALTAWNKGFEDYFVKISFILDDFLKRMAIEDLSPNLSIVAFDSEKPIGIITSGVREINGIKLAWNGGTAVVKEYRHQGVGKQMMDYLLALYKTEGIALSYLEAIEENTKAIELYKKLGYVEKDEIANFSLNRPSSIHVNDSFAGGITFAYSIPQEVQVIEFFKPFHTWQTHWKSVQNGEAVIAFDRNGRVLGYAYFKRVFDEKHHHISTVLYQCEAEPTHSKKEEIVKLLLIKVFGDFSDNINKIVVNVPKNKSATTYNILQSLGFRITVQQIWMEKRLN